MLTSHQNDAYLNGLSNAVYCLSLRCLVIQIVRVPIRPLFAKTELFRARQDRVKPRPALGSRNNPIPLSFDRSKRQQILPPNLGKFSLINFTHSDQRTFPRSWKVSGKWLQNAMFCQFLLQIRVCGDHRQEKCFKKNRLVFTKRYRLEGSGAIQLLSRMHHGCIIVFFPVMMMMIGAQGRRNS